MNGVEEALSGSALSNGGFNKGRNDEAAAPVHVFEIQRATNGPVESEMLCESTSRDQAARQAAILCRLKDAVLLR